LIKLSDIQKAIMANGLMGKYPVEITCKYAQVITDIDSPILLEIDTRTSPHTLLGCPVILDEKMPLDEIRVGDITVKGLKPEHTID
jgi:hypothetical protein